MIRLNVIAAIPLLLLSFTTFAANQSWKINPNGSQISFVGTQNNAPVAGQFKQFSGDINFSPAQLKNSQVRIVVDMNSVTTAYRLIADSLKTADWFNVKLFPQAIFQSNHFSQINNNTFQADGTLTIRDKTEPASFKFTWQELSSQAAKVQGSTTINRTTFGVGQGEWANTSAIKNAVQVNFILNLNKK